MKRLFKILGIALLCLLGILFALGLVGFILYQSADFREPILENRQGEYSLENHQTRYTSFGKSKLRKSDNGFWELYLEGDAQARGEAFGVLCKDLIQEQEKAFVDQIQQIVPNHRYLRCLNFLTILFNRNLKRHIPEEYNREIAALAAHCSHQYDFIGSPFLRQLNYHAAHDIGHAMQEYMLVGCSAYGAWGEQTENGELIVARNFDFYVGDRFAQNKILMFCKPQEGHRFVSVTWPGMIGVLSGMNDQGLSVTINAAKGSIPLSSATPVSILARQILQYASTIQEAYALAEKTQVFVSESFLIGSAREKRCAVIEKSPTRQALYTSPEAIIRLTNHFQSKEFSMDQHNQKQIAESDSPIRLERLGVLTHDLAPLNVEKSVAILRDHSSPEGKDLGLSNPIAINQQIAHHSVVFLPEELKMWISTDHWGYGKWVVYDVGKILNDEKPFEEELYQQDQLIAEDSVFTHRDLAFLSKYRYLKDNLTENCIEEFIRINPFNWATYEHIASYYHQQGMHHKAEGYRRKALRCTIPQGERIKIEKQLK